MEQVLNSRVPTTLAVIWPLLVSSCGTRDTGGCHYDDLAFAGYLNNKLSYVSNKPELIFSFQAESVSLLDISLNKSLLPSNP